MTVHPIGPRDEFTPHACISYTPPVVQHPTVFLDPGHGGIDTGATTTLNGAELYEKTLTLQVARDTAGLLLRAGYPVVLSRSVDASVVRLKPAYIDGNVYTALGDREDLQARVDCANAAHARVLLAIHFDSFGDPTIGGSETYYDDARPFSAQSQRLASLVQRSIVSAFERAGAAVPDRGVAPDSSSGTPALTAQGAAYGHLLELGPASPGFWARPSTMPGALTEPLFISNPSEAAFAAARHGRETLAQALAAAIETFLRGVM